MGGSENILVTLELSFEDTQKELEKITTLPSYLSPWNNHQRLYILFQSYLAINIHCYSIQIARKWFSLDVHQLKIDNGYEMHTYKG